MGHGGDLPFLYFAFLYFDLRQIKYQMDVEIVRPLQAVHNPYMGLI
jgi:hypothetical protein